MSLIKALGKPAKEYIEKHIENIPTFFKNLAENAETEEEAVSAIQRGLKQKVKDAPSPPPSAKGKKEYIKQEPGFTMRDSYDPSKTPALITPASKKVDPEFERTDFNPKGFTMRDPYDPKLTPAIQTKTKPKYSNLQKLLGGAAIVGGTGAALYSDDEPKLPKGVTAKDFFIEEKPKETLTEKLKKPIETKTKAPQAKPKPKAKPIEPIKVGKSEEEKVIESRLNSTLDSYNTLSDPPMTSAEIRKQMADDLKAVKGDKEKTLMWAKLAEGFMNSMIKFSAAKEGLNRGLDMSKVEIQRTDWDKKIDRLQDNYKTEVSNLIDKFDKEDKAKSQVDVSRQKLAERLMDMKQGMARLKDTRAREAERLAQKRAENIQRIKDKQLDRELRERLYKMGITSKEGIARTKADAKAKQAESIDAFWSKFTKDPATAQELGTAAEFGEKSLTIALNRAGVADKLIPGVLKEYRKAAFFGLGPKSTEKVDVGDIRKEYKEYVHEDVQATAPNQFPMTLRKGGQKTTVDNLEELNEAKSEGWK